MNPLEVKVSIKDIEPFNEFLGSLAEFQKAIYKLSGQEEHGDGEINIRELMELGFEGTPIGWGLSRSSPDLRISLKVSPTMDYIRLYFSRGVGSNFELNIQNAKMKDVFNLVETFDLNYKVAKRRQL